MSEPLPYSDFKWNEPTEERLEKILNTDKDSEIGYILEVDLECIDKENTKRFPLAPERKVIDEKYLSKWQKENNPKIYKSLITDLTNKYNYVVHYRVLQFYLKHGLKINRVNRILSFKQKPWLREYISHNTNLRTKGKTDFEKDIWKLMNNSFFGKTMEDIRKRENIELKNNPTRAKKQFSKPTYKRCTEFKDENNETCLIAIHKHKQQVTLHKPIYLSFTILELSKLLMYEFFYNLLIPKWGDDVEILYYDTDAYVLNIKTEDVYKDLETMKEYFDFYDYNLETSPITFENENEKNYNKKVIGKFKDELNGEIMSEWAAIRSKCYAIKKRKTQQLLRIKEFRNKL